MTTAIILDTETTDKEPPIEVIELAWFNSADPSGPFLKRYQPEKMATWGALAVHHILPSELHEEGPSAQALEDVPTVDYWIGHNIDFDWQALGSPPGIKRICTLALSRHLWEEVDSHSLTAMTYFTQGANDATRVKVHRAHSALNDVMLCKELLQVIMEVGKFKTLAELYSASEDARVPRKWGFGKFKGQPISAADRGYANWCRKQPSFDPYVLEALRRAGL